MKQGWLILGASSAMARAFARRLAEDGADLFLAGRDMDDLARNAADCRLRGAASAGAIRFDARKPGGFKAIHEQLSGYDGVLNVAVFVGSMPDQGDIDLDPALIDGAVRDSFTGPAQFLQGFVPLMEERGAGVLIGIGSVAGDRGRAGNYVYGAAKAGFHTYLSGLRNRLTKAGGQVLVVKPGFVDTAMTWGLPGMFLVASPDDVAKDLLRAVAKKKHTLYTPFFWRYIMLIIRATPESIFKKMSI